MALVKPELLVPAGDLEKMRYALAFGADAVYLGMPRFSLRARENGFRDLKQVAEAVAYAHDRGKKVYVTANIFAHNSKVAAFVQYVGEALALCRPDAWILADPGLIMLMKEHFPAEIIHISVQSNVINYAAAQFWFAAGARRIILSREIAISEMQAIRAACPGLELESFVHGAVCIAYSGRCLISNYLAHRDSNQGVCTNSCRWQYRMLSTEPAVDGVPLPGGFYLEESSRKGDLYPIDEDEHGTYLMNAKDLCAIRRLGDLQRAGINSFKVEGRSKTVYYVAMITRVYRRAIDDLSAGREFDPGQMHEIQATSARGFTEGFLNGDPGPEAIEYANSNSAYTTGRFTGIVRGYDAARKMIQVEPRNPILVGRTYELCTPAGNVPLEVKAIFNATGGAVAEVHGGLFSCNIPCPVDPGEFALLREILNK
ncbi:MAG: U32 family peptidase C-terminal domain-containing protein [Candidatus Omnitrophica bacterium]|nr:U32 family peptidase C-terminal domain-containing protein [Candidatus Omnitrophota bacterium]